MEMSLQDACLLVMWGGGKDSTLALVISKGIAEVTGCKLQAVTMFHPGLTDDTVRNIENVRKQLDVAHQWREFLRVVSSDTFDWQPWKVLYARLALATNFHPRFMCVACNLGSTVTEYQAMVDCEAHFRITGNSAGELLVFDDWARSLQQQLSGRTTCVDSTGKTLLDYYRFWWTVYDALLDELQDVTAYEYGAPDTFDRAPYLYACPDPADSPVGSALPLSVLETQECELHPADHMDLLQAFGWHLPGDIQGGTESDCRMPAAIAAINIRKKGLAAHVADLHEAGTALKPSNEMMERAVEWAKTGQSVRHGEQILTEIGVDDIQLRKRPSKSVTGSVATSLVRQLLPVR